MQNQNNTLHSLKLQIMTIFLLVTSYSLLITNCFAQDTLTITTYYPSPYGSYNQLTTTGNTYLATTSGNVGIGTTNPGGGTGRSVLSLANSTAAPTALANTTHLYSLTGEGYWMDAAGNVTLQTPHDPETGEWIFFSKNTRTGRVVRVDMERLVKAVEEVTGKKFMIETFE